MLVGAGALVLASAALVWVGPAILPYPLGLPAALAVTHLLTLGWVTMTIMGASYQLMPVVLQVRLYSERLAHVAFWHFAPGVALLVCGFWLFQTALIVVGGAAVFAGLVMYAWNVAATLRRVETWGLQGAFFAVATVYLIGVGGMGLTLAVNFIWPLLGPALMAHLIFHVVLGLFGWITILAMGVAYKLGPMFALSHGRGDGFGRVVLGLSGGGLALLLAVLSFWPARAAVSAAALVALSGVLLFLWDQWRYLRERSRPRLDLGLRFMAVSFVYLGVAAVLGWLEAAGWVPVPPAVPIVLALLGWAGNLITGQLYKIVPFLIWYERYGPRAGLEPVPLLRDMFSARWGDVSLVTLAPAAALLAVGILAASPATMEVGAVAALAGASALAWNLVRMLRA
jgi:hypothetical protein